MDRHTLLLLNGRPARESHDGGRNYPFYLNFPIESLRHVVVVRGPGSVLYGTNAFKSVINLKLKEPPDEPTLHVQSRGGSFGYFDSTIHGGARAGNFGFYGAVRAGRSDGWDYKATDLTGDTQEQAYRQRGFAGVTHMTYRAFSLDLFAEYGEDFHLGPAPSWSLSPDHKNINKRIFSNLGFQLDLNRDWRMELNCTFNHMSNEFTGRAGSERPLSNDVLGEATLYGKPIDGLNLVIGFLREHQTSRETSGATLPAKYSLTNHSAYAQVDYVLIKKVKLIMGSQWNKPEDQKGNFIFRIGSIINFFKGSGIKLLRSEAYRSPSGVEMSCRFSNNFSGNKYLT